MVDCLLRICAQRHPEVQGVVLVRLIHHKAVVLEQVSIVTLSIVVVDLLSSLDGFARSVHHDEVGVLVPVAPPPELVDLSQPCVR